MPPRPHAAIVGAGFCGAMLAIHLTRAGRDVALFDQSGRFGPGLAYGRARPEHLLNTPAGRMSAFPDDPDHFTRWAHARDPAVTGGSFLPRLVYGAYLEQLIAAHNVTCLSEQVLDTIWHTAHWRVHHTGGALRTRHVVLAVGNLPPTDILKVDDPRHIVDPWSLDPASIDPGLPVLLLGSGLTAIDLALSLASAGHRGPLHLVSRRGQVPQPHRDAAPPSRYTLPDLSQEPATTRALLKALRGEADRAADWRDVIAAVRPHTAALWRRLSLAEQDRFLRHVRPYWDTHRHRAAPASHHAIAELRAAGRLHVHAGKVRSVTVHPHALRVTLRDGTLDVGAIINCTGPTTDIASDSLLDRLHARGLVRRDPLHLGLATDEHGQLSPNLHLVGPLRRASDWESTAVHELGAQVAALAQRLAY